MRRALLPNRTPSLVLAALALIGVLTASGADARRVSAILLLLEPCAWVAACWAAYAAYLRGNLALAVRVVCGVLLGAVLVRVASARPEAPGEAPAATDRLRGCARSLELPVSPLRIAQWHLENSAIEGVADALLAAEPDVVVLSGSPDPSVLDAVREGLGGTQVDLQTPDGSTTFISRGVFQDCGDDDGWTDAPARGSSSAFVFAAVPPATTIPLLLAYLPSPMSEPEYATSARIGRARIASFVGDLQSSLLVVLVDAVGAGGALGLRATLGAARLNHVDHAPNWPAHLLGVSWPFPLHSFDEAWAASAWKPAGVAVLTAASAARNGVMTTLAPRVSVARP